MQIFFISFLVYFCQKNLALRINLFDFTPESGIDLYV